MLRYTLILLIGVFFLAGCAKGPLWKTGKFAPWAVRKLAAEEQIAETIFSKRKRLRQAVAAAKNSSLSAQNDVAEQLSEIARNDSVLLMRIEAIKLLPELDSKVAISALETAALDSAPDARLAAIKGLQQLAAPSSAAVLAQLAERDSELDVRIAATQALSAFNGTLVLQSLNRSLNDRNPAVQTVAIESLQAVTGTKLAKDINQWQEYLASSVGDNETQTANTTPVPRFK